ncbi:hypothetical protein LEN26_009111 [Aphanomyces euteiches]|nr:hypothetical protein AeMF1_010867 [Aphanomyces euteiches]KAH9128358.1 hypothetical protein LEN26_009111 [Aphanomyces euteiches]KAH9131240.1 hypothetical protein AeNC1_019726 [Aphanomyces euteiches]
MPHSQRNLLDTSSSRCSWLEFQLFQSAASGQALNSSDVFCDLTLRVIGLVGFGFDFQNDLEARQAYNNAQLVPETLILVGIPGFLDWPLPSLRRRREAQDKLRQAVNDVIGHKLPATKKEGAQDLYRSRLLTKRLSTP